MLVKGIIGQTLPITQTISGILGSGLNTSKFAAKAVHVD
jgi:hypothetical protein